MRVILHIVRKEFLQILKDRPMMAVIFVVPIVQLLILAYAITTDVTNISMAVLDHDRSVESRDLITKFAVSGRFNVAKNLSTMDAIQDAFDRGDISIAVIVGPDFERHLFRREPASIQIIADGVDSNTALIAAGYARRIISGHFSAKYSWLSPGEVRIRAFYNPELISRFTIIPGIMALLLMIVTTLLTAMGLVREREIGTLEQLNVTPIRPVQLIAGKIIPFVILGSVVFSLAMAVAVMWFHVPMTGSYGTLAVSLGMYLLATLGLGMFISTVTATQQQAVFLSWFILVVSVLMSGFMFPISNMPEMLQKVTYLIPLRYFITILREILLKGATLADLGFQWQMLTMLGSIIFLLAVAKFRKRV
jgi:drug efflux transport system permease protein